MSAFLKRRLVMNTRYSIAGLVAAFKSEEAFRLECVLFALLFPLAFVLGDSRLEVIALVMSLFAVLIAELLNSGLEKTIDRI
ncbi:MAG TPA: diacylglycerol kinase, partial [Burkholderiaceae bacterium]|nr:diacylglycerol kinase [Burkholderiaceae bacterium]